MPGKHDKEHEGKPHFSGVPTKGQAGCQGIFKMTLYTTLQSVESHPYSAILMQQFGEAGDSLRSSSAPPGRAQVRKIAAAQVR